MRPLNVNLVWDHEAERSIVVIQNENGSAGNVKDGVIDAVRGAGEITDAVIDTAARSFVNSIQKTSYVGVVVTVTSSELVRTAIQATVGVSVALNNSIAEAMFGVLRGTGQLGVEPFDLNRSDPTISHNGNGSHGVQEPRGRSWQ
jgi:hypothetical protein